MDAGVGDVRPRTAIGKKSPDDSRDWGRGAAPKGAGGGSGRSNAEKVKDVQTTATRTGERRGQADGGKNLQPGKPGHDRMPSRPDDPREKNERPGDDPLSRRSSNLTSSGKSINGVSVKGSGGDAAGPLAKRNRQDGWYFTKDYLLKHSPSRLDGIDSRRETYLRRSFCTFLQDLGMRLKVPQATIGTAMVFCHRFFTRQSLAKNDRNIIATACMFLAGKVEETPKSLADVISKAFEVMIRKNPEASKKLPQKEEQRRELVLASEGLVLATLGFDFNVEHPYKPLVDGMKRMGVSAQVAQVAWNFVNDGLRTSLCLQFTAPQFAAGALFLAAKFFKMQLPHSDGPLPWWADLDSTPETMKDVCEQLLELYEQCRPVTSSPAAPAVLTAATNATVSSDARIKQLTSASRSPGSEAVAAAAVTKGAGHSGPAPALAARAYALPAAGTADAAASDTRTASPHKRGAAVLPKSSTSPYKHTRAPDVVMQTEGSGAGLLVAGGCAPESPHYTPGKSPLGSLPSGVSEGRRGAHASPPGRGGTHQARAGAPSPHTASPIEPAFDRGGLAPEANASPARASARQRSPLPERQEGRLEERVRVRERGVLRGEEGDTVLRGAEGRQLAQRKVLGLSPVEASGKKGGRGEEGEDEEEEEGEAATGLGRERVGVTREQDKAREESVKERYEGYESSGRGKLGSGGSGGTALMKGVSFKQWATDGEEEVKGARNVRADTAKEISKGGGIDRSFVEASAAAVARSGGVGKDVIPAKTEETGRREEVEEGEDVVAEQLMLRRVDAGSDQKGVAVRQQQQRLQGGVEQDMEEDMEIDSEVEQAVQGGSAKGRAPNDGLSTRVEGAKEEEEEAVGSGDLRVKPVATVLSEQEEVAGGRRGGLGDAGTVGAGGRGVSGAIDGGVLARDKLPSGAKGELQGAESLLKAADGSILKVPSSSLGQVDEEGKVPPSEGEGDKEGAAGERLKRDGSKDRKDSDGSYERKRSEERDGRYGGRRDWERGRDRYTDRDDDRDRYGERDRDRYGGRDRDAYRDRSYDRDRDDRERGHGRDRDRYRDRDRDRGYKRDYEDWDVKDRRDFKDGRDGKDGDKRRSRDDFEYDERASKKSRG